MIFRDAQIGEELYIYDFFDNKKYYGSKCGDNEFLIKENYINPKCINAVFFIEKNTPIERKNK